MKLIGPLVLLALISLVEGEVVNSFAADCPQFFVKDRNGIVVTPTVLVGAQYKLICQKYKNVHRFATLYDTSNRIPVYSAYEFTGYDKEIDRKRIEWKIEPQLDHPHLDRASEDWKKMADMTIEGCDTTRDKWGKHQALCADYSGQEEKIKKKVKYQMGHLYPHCHNCDQDTTESTFTLTNAAPQTGSDNTRWFNQVEDKVRGSIDLCPGGTVHVVTGVIPGDKWIGYKSAKKRNGKSFHEDRVNVPSYFWSAYCCKDTDTDKYLSGGYLAKTETEKMAAEEMSVKALNDKLSEFYKKPFQVFGDVCE